MGESGALASPQGEVFAPSGLLRWEGEVPHEGALQRVGENSDAGAVHLFEKLIVNATRQASGETACERGSVRLST